MLTDKMLAAMGRLATDQAEYTSPKCTPETPARDLGLRPSAALEPPAGEGLDLIAHIEDPAVRAEVTEFQDILGGTLTLADSEFKPTSEAQWRKDAAGSIFAENHKLQTTQYAGMTVMQKQALADAAERREKDERLTWHKEQRQIQLGYAKWWRLRQVNVALADKWRAEHIDGSGDNNWLLAFASLKSVGGVKIPASLSAGLFVRASQRTDKTATKPTRGRKRNECR
jgi:hypothetical protein